MNYPPAPTYVILDFETTGLDPATSEIIEIGAIRVEGLELKERFHRLVRPMGVVPHVISQLTGITNEMLENERGLSEVVPELLDFLRGHELALVAHNAPMEQKFLDHHVAPMAADVVFKVHNSIDPLALILPEHSSHSLESMRKWAGVVTENAHRADQDCEDLLKILNRAQQWLHEDRPYLCKTVLRVMMPENPGLSDTPWWWSWLFAADPETFETPAPARPFLGDLKEMRTADLAREIDWKQAVQEKDISAALNGTLAGKEFQYRKTQDDMAQEIRGAMINGSRIAIEAPTGTGKSVAYLLPGILAARATRAPLVVSTHSKSLQDQLLEKDMPIVRELTGEPGLRATTVKGQENYVCLRKLNDVIGEAVESGDGSLEERWSVAYLAAFAAVSRVGELDRISQYLKIQFPSLEQLIEKVRSHHTTTLGPSCPYYKECHFFDSARLAHQADVIIANHALVFQWPQQLPQIRNIVFDEAHHLEDQITDAYSVKLRETELAENLDRLSKKQGSARKGDTKMLTRLLSTLNLPASAQGGGQSGATDMDPGVTLARMTDAIRTRLTELRGVVPLAIGRDRDAADGYEEVIHMEGIAGTRGGPALLDSLANLTSTVTDLKNYLAAAVGEAEGDKPGYGKSDPALDLLKMHANRFDSYEQKLKTLLDESQPNLIRLMHWSGRENVWRMSVAPIEVGDLSEPFFSSKRAVVLTSATLSTGGAVDFVTSRIGLKPSKPVIKLPSPYALEKQAIIYIPRDISNPGTPAHLDALIDFTERTAQILGGRTLLLMTSNRRLKHAAEILHQRLLPHGITVYDSVSDRRAAENFRGAERALLIGSERYGEGLDIPGRALTCVIIEKINEAMTRSPLAEARKARTKFGLYDYDFPLRMMWLKQRVGRLIRSATDTGAVVIFDPRYHGWSQGSRVQVDRALAPIPIRAAVRDQILQTIEATLS